MNMQPNNGQEVLTSEPRLPSIPPAYYLAAFWRAKRLIAEVVVAILLVAGIYLAVREPVYEISAIIGPNSASSSGSAPSLSTLALSAGINLGSGNANLFDKYQHLLQASRLAEELERRHGVLRHFYPQLWDTKSGHWVPPRDPVSIAKNAIKSVVTGKPWQQPSPELLANTLEKIVFVGQAPGGAGGLNALRSQLIKVSIRFNDRDYAIKLLTYILEDADTLARRDQLEDTENRIDYVEHAIKNTTEVSLYNSLTQILLDQERVLMMVKADKYYAFDMIDPPNGDLFPSNPGIVKILILALVLGLGVSLVLVLFIVRRRVARGMETGEDPFDKPFPDPVMFIWHRLRSIFIRSPQYPPYPPQQD